MLSSTSPSIFSLCSSLLGLFKRPHVLKPPPPPPQQNGVAERKHRHLLDVTRCLLHTMNVPWYYWTVALMNACYLINRMSSSVPNNQVPFRLVFPSTPLNHLPPCVFGCVCFAHSLQPIRDKLSPKSTNFIFLGYATRQKGYRCYDPITHGSFVSSDVTFWVSPYYPRLSTPLPTSPSRVPFPLPVADLPSSSSLHKFANSPITYHRSHNT